MKYSVEFPREAASDIDHIYRADRRLFERVLRKIESLAGDSRQGKPLVGNHQGEFSLRIGSYRIIYIREETKNTVYVLTVKHRKHAY